jgi:hypothetical protein
MAVGRLDGIVEVSENVANILYTHGQPHQLGADAGVALLLDAELLVGGRSRVDDQRFGITDIRQQ